MEISEKIKQYVELLDRAPDAFYLMDALGNFIDGNRAAEELVGRRKEELVGKNFALSGLLPPLQVPRVMAFFARVIAGGETGPEEFDLVRKDGSRVSVEIRTFAISIEGKKLALGIARDITERKAEEKRARAELSSLLNGIILEGSGSQSVREFLKRSLEMIIGKLGFSGGGVYLVDKEGGTARVVHDTGLNKAFVDEVRVVKTDLPPYDALFVRKEPLIAEDYSSVQKERAARFGIGSVISFPIMHKEETIAAVNLASGVPRRCSDEEREFIASAGAQMGTVISKLKAEEELKERLDALEKMNRFMIGRELDMVSLKKEVNALLAELGRSPKYREG